MANRWISNISFIDLKSENRLRKTGDYFVIVCDVVKFPLLTFGVVGYFGGGVEVELVS